MKRKCTSILFITTACLSLLGCGCWGSGLDRTDPLASIFRFNAGEDYSNHIWVYYNGKEIGNGMKPIALDSGFYLFDYVMLPINNIHYLIFTFEERDAHQIPDDWQSHWQDYILATVPYDRFYTVWSGACRDYEDFPAYCGTCDGTFFMDTTILNEMISEGKIKHDGKNIENSLEK